MDVQLQPGDSVTVSYEELTALLGLDLSAEPEGPVEVGSAGPVEAGQGSHSEAYHEGASHVGDMVYGFVSSNGSFIPGVPTGEHGGLELCNGTTVYNTPVYVQPVMRKCMDQDGNGFSTANLWIPPTAAELPVPTSAGNNYWDGNSPAGGQQLGNLGSPSGTNLLNSEGASLNEGGHGSCGGGGGSGNTTTTSSGNSNAAGGSGAAEEQSPVQYSKFKKWKEEGGSTTASSREDLGTKTNWDSFNQKGESFSQKPKKKKKKYTNWSNYGWQKEQEA